MLTAIQQVLDQGPATAAKEAPKDQGQALADGGVGAPQTVPRSPQAWVEEINQAFGYSVGWVVKTGQLLAEAKKELRHGGWSCLFAPGKLKFGLRTAEMLIAVARHPSLRNPKNFSNLPSGWSILHVLSLLPVEIVEQAIADGRVHSEMKLVDAWQLVRTARATAETAQSNCAQKRFDPVPQKQRLLAYLRHTAARWPVEHRRELAELLQAVARELLGGSNAGP